MNEEQEEKKVDQVDEAHQDQAEPSARKKPWRSTKDITVLESKISELETSLAKAEKSVASIKQDLAFAQAKRTELMFLKADELNLLSIIADPEKFKKLSAFVERENLA